MDNKYKTCLSRKGYIIRKSNFTEVEIESIREDLTVTPNVPQGYTQEKPPPFKLFKENENKLYVPRYYGIEKFGNPEVDKMDNGESINVESNIKLRDIQKPIIKDYLDAVEKVGGGIISAKCGIGKTIMSIYLIAHFKVKTLILVHKEFLMNQWIERINQFIPSANIGIIQGPKYDVVNKDIVIGMIQSISQKHYPDYVFRDFGFVISDETHHLGARTFSKALTKTNFKYTLGLSATPNRKDGLSKVFKWNLGDIVFKSKKSKESDVIVHQYKYFNDDQNYCKKVLNYYKKPNNAVMINNITACEKRNKFIISLIPNLIAENRKILILTERLSQVNWFMKEILQQYNVEVGKYVGGMKQRLLDESLLNKVVVGTYTMIEEGFDCPELNTLIMATPKINIEQSVGRILRKRAEDRTVPPLIIDIWDQFANYAFKGIHRGKYYKTRQYKVSIYNVDDNINPTKIDKIEEKKENEAVNKAPVTYNFI